MHAIVSLIQEFSARLRLYCSLTSILEPQRGPRGELERRRGTGAVELGLRRCDLLARRLHNSRYGEFKSRIFGRASPIFLSGINIWSPNGELEPPRGTGAPKGYWSPFRVSSRTPKKKHARACPKLFSCAGGGHEVKFRQRRGNKARGFSVVVVVAMAINIGKNRRSWTMIFDL